ncbi:MAG: hypothetical protein K2G03_03815 [Bacilli bacterium]|nr:hypothetical protein [Bacilli bacterium]MDE6141711.1 hypothetical protein [Bacilli bacterium]
MQFEVKRVKIVVTVPVEDTERIRRVICEAGAGIIGEYSYCSMASRCIGTSMPSDKANPYIGTSNKLEYIEEDKLEVVCDVDKVKKVLKALRDAHPYEEPAIDIIPLIDEDDFK